MSDAPGLGIFGVQHHRGLGPLLGQAGNTVKLGPEIRGHPGPGIKDQGKLPGQFRLGERTFQGFSIDRQGIVTVFFEDRGGYFEFAGGSGKTGLAVGAQEAFFPLLILHDGGIHLHLAAGGTDVFQSEGRTLQDIPQEFLFGLGIEVAVAQTAGQFGKDEKGIAGFADGRNDLFPEAKDGSVGHVGIDLVPGGGRQHQIGIGAVGGEVGIDAGEKIQSLQGLAPETGLRPGSNHGAAQDDQGPDGIGLALKHGRRQGIGVGFAPVQAVDRKAVPAEGLFDIRIRN